MAQQTVSIGSSSNDGTGDPLRTAFTKVNENFSELYQKTGVDTSMTLQLSGNSLISTTTNTDIIIDPNGEGEIYLFGQEDFKISNSSRDSTTANHNITLSNEYADADIIFAVNSGSTTTEIARFDGSASALLVASGKQIQLGGTSTAISGNNSNITMTGNVTVTGNLEIAGTRTEISSTILDVEDPIAENYTLEISSPGIDRPLTRKKDFDSYQGFEAKLETTELIDGRRRFRGVLAGIDDDEVLINLEEGTVGLKFSWLSEARLVLSDDLIKQMLQKNTKIPVLNEENFDEIDTQIEHNEE